MTVEEIKEENVYFGKFALEWQGTYKISKYVTHLNIFQNVKKLFTDVRYYNVAREMLVKTTAAIYISVFQKFNI